MFQYHDTTGLFQHFEVNAEPFWPKVSKLLGGSALFHAILVAAVIFIPPVRNALSIALIFSEGNIVDRPYTKTKIENEGEITEITTEKFHYPEGYFAMDQMPLPTPTPTPPPPVIASAPFETAPVPPALDPFALPAPTASPSPLSAKNATPTPTPDAETQKAIDEAEKELDRVAAESGVKRPKEINTRPFKDLLAKYKQMKDRKELDLSGQIEITAEADCDADGKLKNAHVTDKRGDKQLEEAAIEFIEALSDSGVLEMLGGTQHLKIVAKLDENNVEVTVSSEMETEERANQMASGYGGLIFGARMKAALQKKTDEKAYYDHTNITSSGKEVIVKFSMPRTQMGEMLSKYSTEK